MSHALLSPSAASRWLTCTPSARLELQFPENTGDAAKEGTLAHNFGETILLNFLSRLSGTEFQHRLDVLKEDKFYSTELERYAKEYAAFVEEKFALSRKNTPDAILRIEEKIDLSTYVPEGFGTGDAVILSDGVLEMIDLKYGKGVLVSAIENKQLMLYALGVLEAMDFMYGINSVKLTIYQPRLDNISEWEISARDLISWGERELKPRALMAWRGEGEYVDGKHCQFCRAKTRCRALAEKSMEAAKHEFEAARLLSDEEIASILTKADGIKNWINSVEAYALQQALNGKIFPGFKLVEGRSNRKYSDECKVAQILVENGFTKDAIYEPSKLKSISMMEKLISKPVFSTLLGNCVVKPQGKPTLVPESDNRPRLNDAENDFINISINN